MKIHSRYSGRSASAAKIRVNLSRRSAAKADPRLNLPAKTKNYQTNPFVIFHFARKYSVLSPCAAPNPKKRTHFVARQLVSPKSHEGGSLRAGAFAVPIRRYCYQAETMRLLRRVQSRNCLILLMRAVWLERLRKYCRQFGARIFGFWRGFGEGAGLQNPVTEPKRSQKPKRPLSLPVLPNGYSIF